MTDAGLWIPRAQRPPKVYQPRTRRSCLGELVQIDGSYAIGSATIGVVYMHARLDDSQFFASGLRPQGTDVRFGIVEINASYQVSPALTLGAPYIYNAMKIDFRHHRRMPTA
jgi:predicted porin